MDQQSTNAANDPPLASVETDLFGVLLGFHGKLIALIRSSQLNDEETALATERIRVLFDAAAAEIKRMKDFDLHERLTKVYEEMQAFLKGLEKSPCTDKPIDTNAHDDI